MKVIVTGPKGKMGSLIVKAAHENEKVELVGVVGPKERSYIGQDAGVVTGLGMPIGVLVYDNIEEIIDDCDVVIDFSTVTLSMEVLAACIKHKKALVCGTTGFTKEQEQQFLEGSGQAPLLKAANTSYVTNVMKKLLALAAEALGDKAKIDIIDMHDAKKVDAPSGTSKDFAIEMAEASGKSLDEITHHSVRSGDISSYHNVVFGCMGERLEITHNAYNFGCYAIGAVDAALFLEGKPNGLYSMQDVIGI
ncbi:4-hydroxy-tetrahydrodipicolinate reductase [Clostridium aminobutyricum]|uniref:4-hydroxy-tetrahydrodipicolinate reductase n=2 Tax=Clostridium aminobutyricum TaxID=33953 RepID=A0A939DAV4_CLOAM|nr:4-hydroxy-tetrahydrodipicolinate reductase [Clostridium aminobutyricum]MBN7774345.1 4-hydroxy-tetrahydrodipicolinate reductase [Clostridium aminobutyricum]